MAMMNPTPTSIIITTFSILLNLNLINYEWFTKIISYLGKLIGYNKDHKEKKVKHSPELKESDLIGNCDHECITCITEDCNPKCQTCKELNKPLFDDNNIGTFLALITGAVTSALGFKSMGPDRSLSYKLFNISTSFWRTIAGATRFYTDTITLIKRIFMKIFKTSKETKVARTLANNRAMNEFYQEMIQLLQAINKDYVTKNPQGQLRYHKAIIQATEYSNLLAFNTDPVYMNFKRKCDEFLKECNNHVDLLTSTIARYEPFVKLAPGLAVFRYQINIPLVYLMIHSN
jgi:hypothetical protein